MSVLHWTFWLFTSYLETDSWNLDTPAVCFRCHCMSALISPTHQMFLVVVSWLGVFTVSDRAHNSQWMMALVSHTPVSLPSPLFLSYLWCRLIVFVVAAHVTLSPTTVEEAFSWLIGILWQVISYIWRCPTCMHCMYVSMYGCIDVYMWKWQCVSVRKLSFQCERSIECMIYGCHYKI